ncbi:MAG TPA: hypothetical protein VEY30_00180 [Myxococcaceae bacterium]|nr:hypothetical protein [Myxococcaceae bacterium]
MSTTTGLRDLFKTRSPDDVFELFFPQPFAGLAGDTGSSPALRVEQVYFFRDACEVGLETSSEGDSTAERFEALYSKAIAQGSALSDQEELGERTPLQVARDLVLEAATLGRHSDREALKGELKRALSTLIRFEFPDADLRHAVALDTDRAALGEAYRLAEEVCVSLREDLRRRAQTDPLDMLIRELRSALA